MTWNYNFKDGFFPGLFLLWFILMQWAFPLILTRIQDIKCFESSIFQRIKQPVVRRELRGVMWNFTECGTGADEAGSSSWLYWGHPSYLLTPEPCLQICEFAGLWYASGISLFKIPPSSGSNVDLGLRTTVLTNILERVGHRNLWTYSVVWSVTCLQNYLFSQWPSNFSITEAVLNWKSKLWFWYWAFTLFASECHMACLVPLWAPGNNFIKNWLGFLSVAHLYLSHLGIVHWRSKYLGPTSYTQNQNF